MQTTAEVYQDKGGEWRWRLKARNGRVIADSAEGYVDQDDAIHGLKLATQDPPKHIVVDATTTGAL